MCVGNAFSLLFPFCPPYSCRCSLDADRCRDFILGAECACFLCVMAGSLSQTSFISAVIVESCQYLHRCAGGGTWWNLSGDYYLYTAHGSNEAWLVDCVPTTVSITTANWCSLHWGTIHFHYLSFRISKWKAGWHMFQLSCCSCHLVPKSSIHDSSVKDSMQKKKRPQVREGILK